MLRYTKGDAVWTIAQAGATVTTTLDGAETVESFPSELIARKRFDILLGKHSREGWKRTIAEAPKSPPKPVPKPVPIIENARNEGLEAAIIADPENPEGYRMYADWLEQQGDPRGRLIALSLACEADPKDFKLSTMRDAYRERIERYLYQGVVNMTGSTARIGRGFIETIEYLQDDLAAQLRQTLAAPSGRIVRDIQLDDDGGGNLLDALAVVAAQAPALRKLTIGGRVELAQVDALIAVAPRLREFSVFNVCDRHLLFPDAALRQLLTAPFPELRSLHLDLQRFDPATVNTLFERTDLPNLMQLGLRSSNDAGLLRELADRPLARQLRRLTLERFEYEDIEIWHAARPQFPNLKILEVANPDAWSTDDLDRDFPALEILEAEDYRRWPTLRITGELPEGDGDAYDDIRE